MRSGSFGSQMGTDPIADVRGRRSEWRSWAVVCLGIGLVLLVTGVTMQERRQVERANDLFRQRLVVDEYCFDHAMNSAACNEKPYAEI
jgi:hypothetical protein